MVDEIIVGTGLSILKIIKIFTCNLLLINSHAYKFEL